MTNTLLNTKNMVNTSMNTPVVTPIASISIRAAHAGDRYAVLSMECACFGLARLLFGLWPRVGGRQSMSWVAEVDGKPAGYLIAYDKVLDDALITYVGGVGVLPQYRGQGLGTSLVLSVLSTHSTVWLHVRFNNAAAIGLYQKLGMRELCRISRFYADGDDAVVMATPDLASGPITSGEDHLIYVR